MLLNFQRSLNVYLFEIIYERFIQLINTKRFNSIVSIIGSENVQ